MLNVLIGNKGMLAGGGTWALEAGDHLFHVHPLKATGLFDFILLVQEIGRMPHRLVVKTKSSNMSEHLVWCFPNGRDIQ